MPCIVIGTCYSRLGRLRLKLLGKWPLNLQLKAVSQRVHAMLRSVVLVVRWCVVVPGCAAMCSAVLRRALHGPRRAVRCGAKRSGLVWSGLVWAGLVWWDVVGCGGVGVCVGGGGLCGGESMLGV